MKANIAAEGFYLIERKISCWKCGSETSVFGIHIPPLGYVRNEIEEWERHDSSFTISWIKKINKEALSILENETNLKLSYSKKANLKYLMNHCESCNVKIGDYCLHDDPGGAFCPIDIEQAKKIKARFFDKKIYANCSEIYCSFDFLPFYTKL